MKIFLLLLAAFSSCATASTPTTEPTPLPRLSIDPDRVTVSGISSGAYFALQFQMAHSSLVKGVATVAGGTYWCAEGDASRAPRVCMFSSGEASPERGVAKAREEEAAGRIDPIRLQKAFVFQGEKDFIVHPGHAAHLEAFYQAFLPAEKIKVLRHPNAGHGFPTLSTGNPCDRTALPWINNCGLDLAGEILNFLDEGAPLHSPPGRLLLFSQKPFQTPTNQLYPEGGIYIPAKCEEARCGLHIAFHGCQMNLEFVGKQYMETAGYQKWADEKGLVVLFPQNDKGPGNVHGCWDWFGFTDKAHYINQQGPQIRAVREMVRQLSGF